MNILIATDSFKGSLKSYEAGRIIQSAFQTVYKNAHIKVIPMADGGEGTLETFLVATNGKKIEMQATGPLGGQITTAYGILGDEKTVVIETAEVAGLTMVPESKRNPMITTTYGLGEIILHAIEDGFRDFIIGLGGSATNDGGLGMLQALGASFSDANGLTVNSQGASLKKVKQVNLSSINSKISECNIRIASDVESPLCGPYGASSVFGKQKGATLSQIEELDTALFEYANLVEKDLGKTVRNIKGAGASGGLGFAFLTLNAKMESGAEIMSDVTGLESEISKADMVITGEGQSDSQTLFGKVPFFVAKLANKYHKKPILISGSLGEGFDQLYEYFLSCHSILQKPVTIDEAINHAEQFLFESSRNIAKLRKGLRLLK